MKILPPSNPTVDSEAVLAKPRVESPASPAEPAHTGRRDRLATRVRSVAPSGIRRFFDLIQTMDDVISLGVGEPDFTTPWHIREAAIYSLERGQTMYTSNLGLIELRRAIAEHVARRYGVIYDPNDEVLVTLGVSEGLDLALRAIVDHEAPYGEAR